MGWRWKGRERIGSEKEGREKEKQENRKGRKEGRGRREERKKIWFTEKLLIQTNKLKQDSSS